MSTPLDLRATDELIQRAYRDSEAWGIAEALLAHARALRAALTDVTLAEGHHTVTCDVPRECTCGHDAARAVLAAAQDGPA